VKNVLRVANFAIILKIVKNVLLVIILMHKINASKNAKADIMVTILMEYAQHAMNPAKLA
jgi:hypothetical protein